MGLGQWRLALMISMAWLATTAAAQTIEGVLMPGKLIAGHARFEDDCSKCHLKFDKASQDRLCLDCHKELARDLQEKRGLHGHHAADTCRTCHTDHKGREMNIAPVDLKTFDHGGTGFSLAGAHGKVECKSCHAAGQKFRSAPESCNGCHRKDDKHRGALGAQCADCHMQTTWKDARFDHAKTRFPLTGKHVDTACANCHVENAHKNTPLACASCHRKDDAQHRGRLGEKCESCHNAKNWRDTSSFAHDRDARFALRGRHAMAKCESCHKSPSGLIKVATTCVGCHQADDKHNATLGSACADCHTERNWREAKFNHDLSIFRLVGKHREIECKECHKDPASFKGAPRECIGCHRKDDTHKSRYDEKCASCHSEKSWRDIVFRHDRDTRYALTGKHAQTRCDSCHAGFVYRDKLAGDCFACHQKDDKHVGQLGRGCADCHDTAAWKTTVRFDHAKSRFPLLGRHLATECKSCHLSPAFRDAKRECAGCHAKEDTHKRRLGAECGTCHNARAWTLWAFDHAKGTRYPLEGAHAKVACVACHKAAADKIPALAASCDTCHSGDDVHGGAFGRQCERCHSERSFREIKGFGLRGDAAPAATVAGRRRGTLQ